MELLFDQNEGSESSGMGFLYSMMRLTEKLAGSVDHSTFADNT